MSNAANTADLANELFAKIIAPILDGADPDHFIAIDVQSGDYEVAIRGIDAIQGLTDRHPGIKPFLRKVGSPYVMSRHGGWYCHQPLDWKAPTMRTRYQELRVYILSEKLSDRIWQVVGQWKPFERSTIGGQLVRSADSIGANIAEGAGRGTTKDNCRFIRIARGSLHETQHWLRRAYYRNLLKESEIAELRGFLDELAPKLNAYLNSIANRHPSKPNAPPTSSDTDPE